MNYPEEYPFEDIQIPDGVRGWAHTWHGWTLLDHDFDLMMSGCDAIEIKPSAYDKFAELSEERGFDYPPKAGLWFYDCDKPKDERWVKVADLHAELFHKWKMLDEIKKLVENGYRPYMGIPEWVKRMEQKS